MNGGRTLNFGSQFFWAPSKVVAVVALELGRRRLAVVFIGRFAFFFLLCIWFGFFFLSFFSGNGSFVIATKRKKEEEKKKETTKKKRGNNGEDSVSGVDFDFVLNVFFLFQNETSFFDRLSSPTLAVGCRSSFVFMLSCVSERSRISGRRTSFWFFFVCLFGERRLGQSKKRKRVFF